MEDKSDANRKESWTSWMTINSNGMEESTIIKNEAKIVLGISYDCWIENETNSWVNTRVLQLMKRQIGVFEDGLNDQDDNTDDVNTMDVQVTPKDLSKVNEEDKFLIDCKTRIFFSYRTNFPPIEKSIDGPSPINLNVLFRDNIFNTVNNVIYNPNSFTTDIGWGCMIRTGQSLLGNALQIVSLGRDFRIDKNNVDEKFLDKKIIEWFYDSPKCPFSIHNFVKKGSLLSDKKPGEWFGPAAASTSIKSLIEDFPDCGIDYCIVSISSGDIFKPRVNEIFNQDKNKSILFLLGVKLGLTNYINKYYWDDVKDILQNKFTCGIAGGRPSSSLYFFGYSNDDLLYFDPHKAQEKLDDLFIESCHTQEYRRIQISDIDPSMLIGFIIKGENDWIEFEKSIKSNKIINIMEKTPIVDDIHFEISDENTDDFMNNDLESKTVDDQYIDIKHIKKKMANYLKDSDYIEITKTDQIEELDKFQKLNCENKDILISDGQQELEVEKVLVEKSTSEEE